MNIFPDSLAMFQAAQRFCGNYDAAWNAAGGAQFKILLDAGLLPEHKLLEIGCGCLSAGFVAMQYLEFGGYCGMDPNKWLIDAATGFNPVQKVIAARAPRFSYRADFDGEDFGEKFNFIFAHSVLSHAAPRAMDAFFRACEKNLAEGGKILASIRLSSIGQYYSVDDFWVYPDHCVHKIEAVHDSAHSYGLVVDEKPEYKAVLTLAVPTNFHEWIEVTRA